MYSHIHDALQYLLLGAGEGRALMSNQQQARVVNARKDFDVFSRQPKNATRKQNVWSFVR